MRYDVALEINRGTTGYQTVGHNGCDLVFDCSGNQPSDVIGVAIRPHVGSMGDSFGCWIGIRGKRGKDSSKRTWWT